MVETSLCYLKHEGKYLMLHRVKKKHDINAGKWIGVGGRVEAGETPEECLVREVKEETGLRMKMWSYRGIVDFYNDNGIGDERMYLYTSSDFEGDVSECDEGILKWVPIDEVMELNLWEGDRLFLQDLVDDKPFFHLELHYHGDELVSAQYLTKH